jgi:putative glycosyltransferase (TIGR04372 family)
VPISSKLPLLIQLRGWSLGHFVLDTEVMLHKVNSLDLKQRVYFVKTNKICNETLLDILSKNVSVLSHRYLLIRRILCRLSKGYAKKVNVIESFSYEWVTKAHSKSSIFEPDAEFLEKEFAFLRDEYGLTKDSRLVTLAIRDSGYDDSFQEKSKQPLYRNTPIDYFQHTVEALISRDYSVFRMGQDSNSRLNISASGKYWDLSDIDYPNMERLELAISSIATFMVSTGTGIEQLSAIFRKPIFLVNFAPPYILPSPVYRRVLISQYLVSPNENGKRLGVKELLALGLFDSNPAKEISKGKLKIEPRQPDEILNFVLEIFKFFDRKYLVSGSFNEYIESLEAQGFFVP